MNETSLHQTPVAFARALSTSALAAPTVPKVETREDKCQDGWAPLGAPAEATVMPSGDVARWPVCGVAGEPGDLSHGQGAPQLVLAGPVA